MTSPHPPRPSLVLNVGITGHRANVLPEELTGTLAARLGEEFERLRDACLDLHVREHKLFAEDPPALRLHTALATGADQIAASSAKQKNYSVRALLPFTPEEYARDFATRAEHADFHEHLRSADEFFALPGKREHEQHAYVLVGKAIIAAADILIAVWDGGEGNGPGGTAHVVEMAIRAGVPVLHIQVGREDDELGPCRLIVGGDAMEPAETEMRGPDDYYRLVRKVLALTDEDEIAALMHYYRETEILLNRRIEYPLMLWMLGIKKLPKPLWHQASIAENAWEKLGGRQETGDPHFAAYNWANFLAIRTAQRFRSGHVTNYMLSALAVLVALFGLLVPPLKPFLVVAELGIISLLFQNTKFGGKREWHRRWLQYRHLAESLRPLAYLKRTGLAGPPFRDEAPTAGQTKTAHADWTRWYAAAIWREMGCPIGIVDDAMLKGLVGEVLEQQIDPQIAYHHVNAERMHKLDHRLHEVGNFLMGTVIAACGLYLVGYLFAYELVKELTYFFVFITAGLPALGAAVFGLRGHGEHLLTASRSTSTMNALTVNKKRLSQAGDLETLSSELEKTGEIMLDDLSEWNLAYSERALQVPA